MTFHNMIAGCEQGSREAWESFIASYTPVAFRLFDVYLRGQAGPRAEREKFWKEALESLAAHDCQRLRGFERQAEREFLSDFRIFVLERGRSRLDPALDETTGPRLTPETAGALLEGLPLLHQEIVYFKLTGYSDATIERVLRITPAVAQKGIERLQAGYGAALRRESDEGMWPAAWLDVLKHAWSAKTEACAPLRQFIRIQDGQTSWYDKEPVEEHIARCVHCLERWTALREIDYLRHRSQAPTAAEIAAFLSVIPLATGVRKQKPFLRRMFG